MKSTIIENKHIDFIQLFKKLFFSRLQPSQSNHRVETREYIMTSQPKLVYGEDELANVIALYESYLVNVESNLISDKQMFQKGDMFLSWVNDLLAAKLKTINQITLRSIEIFKQISTDQVDISARILQLQHACAQKNTAIQNHVDTIRHLENKLLQRDNDIEKMKQQIQQLTEKIDKQQNNFNRQTKQFKKTFAIIRESTESDKQIMDSIQFQYEYQKQQKDMIKDQLDDLIQQKAIILNQLEEIKRFNKASENKLEWEIKKKMSLEQVIKEKNLLIEKLLLEIKDLKDTINPYHDIQEENLNEKDIDDLSQATKQRIDKNLLSQQMALRQSFFSEADLQDSFIRRNSFRKSFDDTHNPSQNNFQYPGSNDNHSNNNYKKMDSINENGSSKENMKQKKSMQEEQTNSRYQEKKNPLISIKSPDQSLNSIMIRDMQLTKSHTIGQGLSSYKKSEHNSPGKRLPQVNKFESGPHQRQKELQIITQKLQYGKQQSKIEPFRRHNHDLYFAHFLLTSQAVKIKEDCQQMLNIDVKQYYQEIIQKRIPMHIWDDWVRDKLRNAVKELKAKNQIARKRQTSHVNI